MQKGDKKMSGQKDKEKITYTLMEWEKRTIMEEVGTLSAVLVGNANLVHKIHTGWGKYVYVVPEWFFKYCEEKRQEEETKDE